MAATHTVVTWYHGTLSNAAVDAITISNPWPSITVINRDGTGEIYFTVDGSTPTPGEDNTYVVPATIGTATVQSPNSPTVNLIASGSTTPKYSVGII